MNRTRTSLIILAGWIAFGVFLSVEMSLFHPPWMVPFNFGHELLWELSLSLICAGSTPLVLWLSRRFPIERGVWLPHLGLHLAIGIVLSLIECAIHGFIMMALGLPLQRWSLGGLLPSFFYNMDKMAIVYWAIVFVEHSRSYARQLKEKEARESQLETRLVQAQLQALKMQLHPHFLFNTLNAITTLLHKDPRGAERMIVRLGDLLRTTLENSGRQFVPLREETQFLRDYLEIEQVRFQDRLSVKFDLPDDTLELPVPFLLLQPLAENAIRHGFGSSFSSGCIQIIARRENGNLRLTVEDDGVGIRAEKAASGRAGLGLATTRARLQQISASASLTLARNEKGGTRASIVLPVSTAPP
ncbi:MAG TPA: histidine kinase [Bacteroidota bacterium]|nr:histidine kinase [Bacteroidota bacterium]